MTKGPFDGTSVFILEDEPLLRKRLVAHLEKQGADTMAVGTLAQARTCLAEATFDVALIDIGLPDGSGLDLLNESLFGPSTPIIVMTAMGGVQTAVNAMKLGACDFITKPVEPDVLSLAMLRARQGRQTRRIEEFRSGGRGDLFFCEATRGVREMLDRIMQAESRLGGGLPPVLIEGETGTGKTSIARWLHNNGARKDKPFIDVNCSALPESLAESELFGHEKGAFTDARQMRIGLFEAADGGTLFLDEIPSLSLPIQAKVLKAVEEGRIRRVGSRKDVAVDVRLITATNRDLGQMAARGEFREDLMHRLDLLRIKMPPLREWGEGIAELAQHLLSALERKYRLKGLKISPDGRRRLMAWNWPGNIRELSHELERGVVMSMGTDAMDFPNLPCPAEDRKASGDGEGWFVEGYRFPEAGGFDIEKAILHIIDRALAQSGGNVSAAARLLNVPRDYIRYRIKDR